MAFTLAATEVAVNQATALERGRDVEVAGSRLLTWRRPPERTTAGGLEIPQTALESPDESLIVALGDAVKDERATVGRWVSFNRWAGVPFKLDGIDYLILNEADILVYLRK